MLTVNVGHGQRPGSGAANVSSARPCQRAQRSADEDRGQLPSVETEHEPK